MKKVLSIIFAITILCSSLAVVSFADNEAGSLSDVVKQSEAIEVEVNNEESSEEIVITNEETTDSIDEKSDIETNSELTEDTGKISISEANKNFIEGVGKASDLTPAVEEAQKLTSGAVKVAAFIVQVLSYIIVAFLAVRVLVDLLYIAIPMTRTFLANGYGGNPQMGGNMQNANLGMTGMGGMGSRYGKGYGRYGQGMMTGMNNMGMTGMGANSMGAMGAMGANNGMAMGNQRNSMFGQVQWVSNAALNAVASESAVGPDGKAPSAFKIYAKDMIVVLIITPVLIVLAATGVLTQLGLVIGEALIRVIQKLSLML